MFLCGIIFFFTIFSWYRDKSVLDSPRSALYIFPSSVICLILTTEWWYRVFPFFAWVDTDWFGLWRRPWSSRTTYQYRNNGWLQMRSVSHWLVVTIVCYNLQLYPASLYGSFFAISSIWLQSCWQSDDVWHHPFIFYDCLKETVRPKALSADTVDCGWLCHGILMMAITIVTHTTCLEFR